MKQIKAMLPISIVVLIVVSFLGYKVIDAFYKHKYISETNLRAESILSEQALIAENTFRTNQVLFQRIVDEIEDIPVATAKLNDAGIKAQIYINSTNEVSFVMFSDTYESCFYDVIITYSIQPQTENNYLVGLADNWYLIKNIYWGT